MNQRIRLMRAALILASAASPVAFAQSCALSGFDREAESALDAGPPDAGGADGESDATTCTHTSFPDPPPSEPTGDAGMIVSAIRLIDFGEGKKQEIGIDLDRRCTCEGDGPSCQTRATMTPDAGCDGVGGVDNEGRKLFALLALFGAQGFGSPYYSKVMESGGGTALLRVSDYNGAPDDKQVTLTWYVTMGYHFVNDGGVPKWDGTDKWPISSDCLVDASVDSPRFVDTHAYVTNGVLVANLAESDFFLGDLTSRIDIRVKQGYLVAKVEKLADAGSAWTLRDGLLAGRWNLPDVFHALSSYRSNKGDPFCTNSPVYGQAKALYCGAADLPSQIDSLSSVVCDAISFGVLFQTFPAVLGDVLTPPPPLPGCTPDIDPGNDSCDGPVDAGSKPDGGP